MSDDDDQLLRALGRVAREREREAAPPPVLDELARARIADGIAKRIRKPSPLRFLWAAGGFAAAAALVLLVRSRSVDPLPLYLVHASGSSTVRGPTAPATDCNLHASEQGAFEVVAQANEAVTGPIAARAFVVHGTEVDPLIMRAEVSEQGSVRIAGPSRLLLGATELRIVIARGQEVVANQTGRDSQTLRCTVEN